MNNNQGMGSWVSTAIFKEIFFCRMTESCQKKCVPPKNYSDSELTKAESVCIDRCVAKFMDVHDRIGKKLTAMSNPEQGGQGQLPGTVPK